jgi:hypothetical protein
LTLTEPERVALDHLRSLRGAAALVIDEAALVAKTDLGTVAVALAKLGVPVQEPAGIIDGARLERALSHDGMTATERAAAIVAQRMKPAPPMVRAYPGGPLVSADGKALSDCEGLYSLGRAVDRGGNPWND